MAKNLMLRRQLGWRLFISGSLTVGALLVAVSAARADTLATDPDWTATAQCESSGNWAIHTGMYEGGLQFLPSTWVAYGGTQYAPHAYQATPGQQIAVATKVLAAQGPRAWPVCFRGGTGVGRQPAVVSPVSQHQRVLASSPVPPVQANLAPRRSCHGNHHRARHHHIHHR